MLEIIIIVGMDYVKCSASRCNAHFHLTSNYCGEHYCMACRLEKVENELKMEEELSR